MWCEFPVKGVQTWRAASNEGPTIRTSRLSMWSCLRKSTSLATLDGEARRSMEARGALVEKSSVPDSGRSVFNKVDNMFGTRGSLSRDRRNLVACLFLVSFLLFSPLCSASPHDPHVPRCSSVWKGRGSVCPWFEVRILLPVTVLVSVSLLLKVIILH